MALHVSEIEFDHREILLKNKPPQMLNASPKGMVPVLVLPDQTMIDESLEVMLWALRQHDPENWLGEDEQFLSAAWPLITWCDGEFKRWLDRYKYADRHSEPAEYYRGQGIPFLTWLEQMLAEQKHLLDTVVTRFSSKWPNSEYGQPPEKSQRFSHNVSQSVANV